MNARKRPYHLLEAHHLTVTYSVVDRDDLRVRPLISELFKGSGPWQRIGVMEWRPGMADHQVLLRSNRPARKWSSLKDRFTAQVKGLDAVLARYNAMLLPTGAHPFMVPAGEAVVPERPEAPALAHYRRAFELERHGWCNDQRAEQSFTFAGDTEFGKLHAATRLLLPILPGLCASSPFLKGRSAGFLDARLEASLHTYDPYVEFVGSVVPEAVFTQEDHDREILAPIAQALGGLDAIPGIDPEQANDRAAVAFFDRGLLTLRIADVQECTSADLAIAEFINAVLKALTSGRWVSTYLQRAWSESDLLPLLLQTMKDAGQTLITNRDYLLMFGLMKQEHLTVQKLWQHLFVELYGELGADARTRIAHILEHGCLASRILKHTGRTPSLDQLRTTYRQLGECLREDRMFA
jgi:carboxylate-amine ligase